MINFLVATPKPAFVKVTALISFFLVRMVPHWCASFWKNSFEATIIKALYIFSENVFTLTQNFL